MNSRFFFILFFFFFGVKLAISFEYASKLFCEFPEIRSGSLTAFTGDSFSYTPAMENYITKGDYYFEVNGKKIYAGRVAHYSVPYYLLRIFFNKRTSLDLFIILQILLESIAFFLVSRIIFEMTGSKLVFYLSLLFSVASFFYLHYSLIPITDSPASSLLLISFWFLFGYLNSSERRFSQWISFSVLLAMATILRPYFGLIFLFVLVLLFLKYGVAFLTVFKNGLVYASVLLLLLAPWIARNYVRSGKLILFQQDKYAGYDISKELELTRKMLAAIGEDGTTMWDKTAAAGYFSPSMYKTSIWKVPAEISSDTILSSNFLAIRNLCIDSVDDRSQSTAYNFHFNAFMDQYKAKNKVRYYFLNYINRVKVFLFHSGSYYYRYKEGDGCSKKINYYLKGTQSLFYYLCLIPGFIGLLLIGGKKHGSIFLIPSLTLILVFPILLGWVEWRYFLPFYFFHQIGLFYLFHEVLLFFKLRI